MRTSDTARVPSVEWDGQPGFERFSAHGRFAVPDARSFRASWRHVAVDGVRIVEWSTSPVSGATAARRDVATVTMAAVIDGSMRYWANGTAVDARSGSMHLISGTDAFRFAVPERSRFVLVEAPAASLPADLRPAMSVSIGPVPGTRITVGLAALLEQVLDPAVGGASCAAARAVRAVAVAAMEDSAPDPEQHDLRGRIVDHIERRIGDPDLGPQSIAADYGISLRWVHQIFDVDGSSVARHIRRRRLDLVATRLRSERRVPRIGALAERSGFGSRDQLTRAFKARFGVTIAEYAALAWAGSAPRPLVAADDDQEERSA
jgi:AraC-like DNA-binding protein